MLLHQFDLNLLRSLDALLRERNVTRAAEHNHVTQQAMSGALKRLRAHFGDELLTRAGRGLRLTPQGQALIEPVREAMRQIDQTLQTRPSFEAATSERRFRIAMSDYATLTLLPTVMAMLMAQAPGMVLDVELIAEKTFDELDGGDLDLCLLPSDWSLFADHPPRDVHSCSLYQDDFVCVTSRDNGAFDKTIDADQYVEAPQVVLRLGNGVSSLIEAAWRKLGIAPRIAATATSFSAMLFMVVEAPLVATVQRQLARRFERMLPLRVLDCPIPIEPLCGDMSWPISREKDPAHAFLREIFVAASRRAD